MGPVSWAHVRAARSKRHTSASGTFSVGDVRAIPPYSVSTPSEATSIRKLADWWRLSGERRAHVRAARSKLHTSASGTFSVGDVRAIPPYSVRTPSEATSIRKLDDWWRAGRHRTMKLLENHNFFREMEIQWQTRNLTNVEI